MEESENQVSDERVPLTAVVGRAIAGTEHVIGRGVTIKDITVKEHVKWDQSIFRELVGMTLSERWPGALNDVRIEFQLEA